MDDPPISARHLMLCRQVDFNPRDPDACYSAKGVLGAITPDEEYGYPFCLELVWLFAQLYGTPGRYFVRVELVRLDDDETDAGPVTTLRSQAPVRVREGEFVEGVRFRLTQVVFPEAGLYEVRLMLDGFDNPIAIERVYLKEV